MVPRKDSERGGGGGGGGAGTDFPTTTVENLIDAFVAFSKDKLDLLLYNKQQMHNTTQSSLLWIFYDALFCRRDLITKLQSFWSSSAQTPMREIT